jgi:hypothetical protein
LWGVQVEGRSSFPGSLEPALPRKDGPVLGRFIARRDFALVWR